MRLWYEVDINKENFDKKEIIKNETIEKRWFPYNKGGGYRKWYGYNEYIIDWKNDAQEIRNIPTAVIANYQFFMKPGLTWSTISSNKFSIRAFESGFIFDNGGCCLFTDNELRLYYLSLLNSLIFEYIFSKTNPTLNFQAGEVAKFPVIENNEYLALINNIATQNISISRTDWDNNETSWDFTEHPLLKFKDSIIEASFNAWSTFTEDSFYKLKFNEKELNCIFIDIYGLHDELIPEVEDKDITVCKADRERDIKSFISYAVGCMLGRYSLDEEGLVLAGGNFNPERYKTFKADADGILPVLSDAYFDDDIVTQFVEFVKVTFEENTLATNLDYIAETLRRKANESSRECIRRYFLKDFYKDHVQKYKKRPIYWLFTSGKEQGFNALVYMHRYDSSMVSRVRTDYLHPLQNKLEAEYLRLNQVLVSEDSPTEKTKATKRLKELTKQMDELKKYDEVIHNLADQQIEIDLDDGVVVNYAKFEKVLAKI